MYKWSMTINKMILDKVIISAGQNPDHLVFNCCSELSMHL